jgi:TM2 domain-containing membrane protein YozV
MPQSVSGCSVPGKEGAMAGQGSAGNVIAALASFFIPGLGQLLQGRLVMALIQFCLAAALWLILMGWIIHLWSILDAALWKPKAS